MGVAYNSPTWYKMSDYFKATANSDTYYWREPVVAYTPEKAFYDYEYRSPDKWLFSAAFIIGRSALLSVDYELTNYGKMKVYDGAGSEDQVTNNDVKANFGSAATTLRIGGEVKVTPRFAVRAGASWIGNPMSDVLKKATAEVYTVGTIPHYTIEKGITNYTVGLGYRFTPNFYMDIACVLKSEKEDLYAFSNIYSAEGRKIINSQSASLKTNTTQMALTLGYKF
jgi:long-subunit fatty acid transport protein